MNRLLPIIFLATIYLVACDIRKQETKNKKSPTQSKSITDSTTVQIIDTTYNFGNVKEGEVVEYSFRFKNTGSKALVIDQANASCGCTVPEKPDHPIAAGELGFIKVKFNTQGRPGDARKSISVVSNARPEFPTLFLKGTVLGKETN